MHVFYGEQQNPFGSWSPMAIAATTKTKNKKHKLKKSQIKKKQKFPKIENPKIEKSKNPKDMSTNHVNNMWNMRGSNNIQKKQNQIKNTELRQKKKSDWQNQQNSPCAKCIAVKTDHDRGNRGQVECIIGLGAEEDKFLPEFHEAELILRDGHEGKGVWHRRPLAPTVFWGREMSLLLRPLPTPWSWWVTGAD